MANFKKSKPFEKHEEDLLTSELNRLDSVKPILGRSKSSLISIGEKLTDQILGLGRPSGAKAASETMMRLNDPLITRKTLTLDTVIDNEYQLTADKAQLFSKIPSDPSNLKLSNPPVSKGQNAALDKFINGENIAMLETWTKSHDFMGWDGNLNTNLISNLKLKKLDEVILAKLDKISPTEKSNMKIAGYFIEKNQTGLSSITLVVWLYLFYQRVVVLHVDKLVKLSNFSPALALKFPSESVNIATWLNMMKKTEYVNYLQQAIDSINMGFVDSYDYTIFDAEFNGLYMTDANTTSTAVDCSVTFDDVYYDKDDLPFGQSIFDENAVRTDAETSSETNKFQLFIFKAEGDNDDEDTDRVWIADDSLVDVDQITSLHILLSKLVKTGTYKGLDILNNTPATLDNSDESLIPQRNSSIALQNAAVGIVNYTTDIRELMINSNLNFEQRFFGPVKGNDIRLYSDRLINFKSQTHLFNFLMNGFDLVNGAYIRTNQRGPEITDLSMNIPVFNRNLMPNFLVDSQFLFYVNSLSHKPNFVLKPTSLISSLSNVTENLTTNMVLEFIDGKPGAVVLTSVAGNLMDYLDIFNTLAREYWNLAVEITVGDESVRVHTRHSEILYYTVSRQPQIDFFNYNDEISIVDRDIREILVKQVNDVVAKFKVGKQQKAKKEKIENKLVEETASLV